MTTQQQDRISLLTTRLACHPKDYVLDEDPVDLEPGWISVTIGQGKGRPKTFDIAPDGEPHA